MENQPLPPLTMRPKLHITCLPPTSEHLFEARSVLSLHLEIGKLVPKEANLERCHCHSAVSVSDKGKIQTLSFSF